MGRRYVGVVWHARARSFEAQVSTKDTAYFLGRWPTEREAVIARDRALLHFGGRPERLQLPGASRKLGPASPADLRRLARMQIKEARGMASRYLGVVFVPSVSRWSIEVRSRGKNHRVGGYRTDVEAAIARDRVALYFQADKATLNFPDRVLRPASPEALRREAGRPERRAISSRYLGVKAEPSPRGWTALIAFDRRTYRVHGFKTERAAAEARDRMALYFQGSKAKLNFPKKGLAPCSPEELRQEQLRRRKERTSSRYVGVFFLIRSSRLPWAARLGPHSLGLWETEQAAALAVDRARFFHGGNLSLLNFPKRARRLKPADAATLRAEARRAFKAGTTSEFRGVHRTREGTWGVTISHKNRTVYVGRFTDEVAAARAYDRAAARFHGERAKLNFGAKCPAQPRPAGPCDE